MKKKLLMLISLTMIVSLLSGCAALDKLLLGEDTSQKETVSEEDIPKFSSKDSEPRLAEKEESHKEDKASIDPHDIPLRNYKIKDVRSSYFNSYIKGLCAKGEILEAYSQGTIELQYNHSHAYLYETLGNDHMLVELKNDTLNCRWELSQSSIGQMENVIDSNDLVQEENGLSSLNYHCEKVAKNVRIVFTPEGLYHDFANMTITDCERIDDETGIYDHLIIHQDKETKPKSDHHGGQTKGIKGYEYDIYIDPVNDIITSMTAYILYDGEENSDYKWYDIKFVKQGTYDINDTINTFPPTFRDKKTVKANVFEEVYAKWLLVHFGQNGVLYGIK